MKVEARTYKISCLIDRLEYDLKIAKLNDRLGDAEDIKEEIVELENELMALGY